MDIQHIKKEIQTRLKATLGIKLLGVVEQGNQVVVQFDCNGIPKSAKFPFDAPPWRIWDKWLGSIIAIESVASVCPKSSGLPWYRRDR